MDDFTKELLRSADPRKAPPLGSTPKPEELDSTWLGGGPSEPSGFLVFLFPQRIARMSYFLRSVALSIGLVPVIEAYECGPSANDALWVLLLIAAAAYAMIFIILARCRDIDGGWGMALLCLVPIANLVVGWSLLFARSHPIRVARMGDWDLGNGTEKKKYAQPSATDNPGDAQRSREDH